MCHTFSAQHLKGNAKALAVEIFRLHTLRGTCAKATFHNSSMVDAHPMPILFVWESPLPPPGIYCFNLTTQFLTLSKSKFGSSTTSVWITEPLTFSPILAQILREFDTEFFNRPITHNLWSGILFLFLEFKKNAWLLVKSPRAERSLHLPK